MLSKFKREFLVIAVEKEISVYLII